MSLTESVWNCAPKTCIRGKNIPFENGKEKERPWTKYVKNNYIHRPDDGGRNSSETSVKFYQITGRHNPEDSHLQTRYRKNLKSYNQQRCERA
jgi:hypothetical protein